MEILRRKLCALVRGDEGVALVVTLALFMVLYVSCAGVFAIGRTVKERILLQNAVDAAAYSAAVVQADTLSRIATINRAMAWTYQEKLCSQLNWVAYNFTLKSSVDYAANASNAKWIGSDTVDDPFTIRLLTGESEDPIFQESKLAEMVVGQDLKNLESRIAQCNGQLEDMSEAVRELARQLKDRVNAVIAETLDANLPVQMGELSMFKIVTHDPLGGDSDWLVEMQTDEASEDRFVHFAGESNEGYSDSRWFKLTSANADQNSSFLRKFMGLKSFWKWVPKVIGGVKYENVDAERDFGNEDDGFPGAFEDVVARPLILDSKYFPDQGAKGSISVVVAKHNRNPWESFTCDVDGLRSAFNYATRNDWTFAVASAQAAYRVAGLEAEDDAMPDYSLVWKENADWNLSTPDWDAVFVPVRKALTTAEFKKLITGGGWSQVSASNSNLPKAAEDGLVLARDVLENGTFNDRRLPRMHNNSGVENVLDWSSDGILNMMYH